jgi:AmmeMemoRadiSam system protein A
MTRIHGTGGGSALLPEPPEPGLVPEALRPLLVRVAEDAIRAVLEGRRWDPDPAAYPAELRRSAPCFVTLHDGTRLLGCIGTLDAAQPLVSTVADRAQQAAFADPRFPPITAEEFGRATIEVSVLGPCEPLEAANLDRLLHALRPGVDGVVVSAPGHRATFLPDVWAQLTDPALFVDALWRKAGLRPGTWPPGVRVCRYRTETAVGAPPRQAPDPIPVARRS